VLGADFEFFCVERTDQHQQQEKKKENWHSQTDLLPGEETARKLNWFFAWNLQYMRGNALSIGHLHPLLQNSPLTQISCCCCCLFQLFT
jgi:hypothetical protein